MSGHCVRLIFPDVDDLGTTDKLWTSESGQRIEGFIGRIAARWGGVTISDGHGVWTDNEGRPISEHVFVAECSIGLWDQIARDWWHELADEVRSELRQTCVFLSVREEHAELIGQSGVEVIGQ